MSTRAATAASTAREGEVWTVLRTMEWSGEYLQERGIERGRLDAEILLASVLGVGRLDLYLQFDRPLTPQELDRYRPLLRRRARREPLQYVLGRAAFRELELEVGPGVLIPRPETEVLVGEILDWAREEELRDGRALDLGTGSGAIALSLLLEGPFASVVATDVSSEALGWARRNAERIHAPGTVEFRLGADFKPVLPGERFHVVVSNPPYLAEGEADALQPEVRDWEPGTALFAGPDGLGAIRRIAAGAGSSWTTAGSWRWR